MNMKHRIICLAGLMAFCLATFAQQYQMEVKTTDGNITSYLMSSVNDVVYENGKTIINMNGSAKKEYDNREIVNISWKEFNGAISDLESTFTLDEEHNSVVTPQFSISFDCTVIQEKTTLTVTRQKSIPISSDLKQGRNKWVCFDFNLGDRHELNGIAEIRIPMTVSDDSFAAGLYYNETTKKWEMVNSYYDTETGEVVIRTPHLSRFAGFDLKNSFRRNAMLVYSYVPSTTDPIDALVRKMWEFTQSDNPDAAAIEEYGSDYSTMTQWGIDIGWSAFMSVGGGSMLLEDFADVLGKLGVALSVYQICRNNYSGDEPQLAGNTLKLCLQQSIAWATFYCGNAILTASMACVAFIDFAVNKYMSEAWSMRKDHYREAMNDYYRKEGNTHDANIHYRTALDWYNALKPIMTRKDLTADDIHFKVDEEVKRYCHEVWEDKDYLTWFEVDKGVTFKWGSGTVVCEDLAEEMRGELYNGVLVSVFRKFKMEEEQRAYEEAKKQMNQYAHILNMIVTLKFIDSSVGEDGKSRFAGSIVRFKDLPKAVQNPKNWECTLSDKGEGKIQYTFLAAIDPGVTPVLEVLSNDTDKSPLAVIHLSDLNAGYEDTETTKANMIDLSKHINFDIEMDPSSMDFGYEGGNATATILTTGLSDLSVSATANFIHATLKGNTINVVVNQNETDSQRSGLVCVEGVAADGSAKKGYLTIEQGIKPVAFKVLNIGLIGLQKNGASYRSFVNKDFKSCNAFFDGSNYIIESVLADNRTLKVTIKKVGTGNKKFGDAYMIYEEKNDYNDGFVKVYGNLPLDVSNDSHGTWKGKCMVHSKWLEGWEPDTHYEEGEGMNDVETTLILNFGDVSLLP